MTEHVFQSEVKQLLNIVIHSLYSEREIFLRELISNASDACDKLRFRSLTETELLKGDSDFKINVDFDKEAKTLTITDNGIGLTEEEAVEHLGTIAKSGTKSFLEAAGDEKAGDLSGLIGQFGVGFYASFMVADKVVVESRSATASSDDGVRWESAGDGAFVTEKIARPQRGTAITLHLREDAHEFAEGFRLRSLIKKHSDYVSYPVFLPKEAAPTAEDDKEEEKSDAPEIEQVNEGKALWTKSKSEISDEDYAAFYKSACHAWDEPATHIHASVEGTMSFTTLLFIPGSKPFDMFDRDKRGLNLYVRRVFIMDNCEELLPEYLRFVKGIVDSDDLPLNVSRELLQNDNTVRKLRKQLVKRILDHLDKLARSEDENDQKTFASISENFGTVIREGIVNDMDNKDRIAKISRWESTWTLEQENEEGQTLRTSLDDYIERMSEDQDKIYFITGPSLAAVRNAPQLEGFKKSGKEVLFLTDPIDEWVSQHLNEYNEKELVSVAKGDAEVDESEQEKIKEKTEEFKDFLSFGKDSLDGGIKEVRLSTRLTDSPCCVVSDQAGMSTNMEEMMKQFGQAAPAQERILELNPEHALVQRLQEMYKAEDDKDLVGDAFNVLRDQALLAEGAPLANQGKFAERVQKLMSKAFL